MAAVVGYAFAYQLYDKFYESFGLTPEQVGVDRIGALLRMTPAMFVIGMIVFVLAFAFVGTMAVLRSMVAQAVSWQVSARTYAGCTGMLLFAALMFVDWSRQQDGLGSIFPQSATFRSSVAMGVVLIGLYLLVRWFTRRWAPLVASLAAIAVLGYQVSEAVSLGAWQLHRTGESSVALWFAGISPHYASVRWVDPQRKPQSVIEYVPSNPEEPPNVLVILSQSANSYALYDCRTGRAHVASAADVVIERMVVPISAESGLWTRRALGCSGTR